MPPVPGQVPFFLPMSPTVMPREPFDALIAKYGTRFNYLKSHSCPCVYGSTIPGSADPNCQSCGGKGVYWDAPLGPFVAFRTFRNLSPTPDEPGMSHDPTTGQSISADPTITIPYGSGVVTQTIWTQASEFDAVVELDTLERFNDILTKGQKQIIPYQQGLTIAPSGAVTIYNQTTGIVSQVAGYTVSGAVVLLPSTFTTGQSYVVEFFANPVYVMYRKSGGLPHARPFGGTAPENLPKVFKLQTLDVWVRANSSYPNTASPQSQRT